LPLIEPDCTTIGVTPNTEGGVSGFITPLIMIVRLHTSIIVNKQHRIAPIINMIFFVTLLFAIRLSSVRIVFRLLIFMQKLC